MSAFVCGECLADEGLARFVARAASADACSFCTQAHDSPIAASVSDVANLMRQCLEQDYGHPTADQAGGYPPGAIFATHALLDKVPLQLRNPTVLGPLCEKIGLNLEWCEKDPFRFTGADKLLFDWFSFRRYVQHVSRFFVFAAKTDTPIAGDGEDHTSPAALLESVGRIAVAAGSVKTLPSSMPIFRARSVTAQSEIGSSSNLGPPPPDKASQNRMSAAGIPMFYASDDPETAVTEISESSSSLYAVAEFRAERDCRMLDLTNLPDIPTFFELGNRDVREQMEFLHRFAEDISLPVEDQDSVHIEYVPTQVVTEYFRAVFTAKRCAARPNSMRGATRISTCAATATIWSSPSSIVPPHRPAASTSPSKPTALARIRAGAAREVRPYRDYKIGDRHPDRTMIYGGCAGRARRADRNLGAQVAALIARIAELEARLAQNSSNSNRPPSPDAPPIAMPDQGSPPPAGRVADNAVTRAGNARCCRRRR